jgi:hypothetical protein
MEIKRPTIGVWYCSVMDSAVLARVIAINGDTAVVLTGSRRLTCTVDEFAMSWRLL